jgi:hypothetical protein
VSCIIAYPPSRFADSADGMLPIIKVCTKSSKVDLLSHVHEILSAFASFPDFDAAYSPNQASSSDNLVNFDDSRITPVMKRARGIPSSFRLLIRAFTSPKAREASHFFTHP